MLRRFGSAFCDMTHEIGGTTCYRHWILRLVISHTRQGVRFVRDWVLRLFMSHTKQGVRIVSGIVSASCDLTYETAGQVVRFVTGIGFCIL